MTGWGAEQLTREELLNLGAKLSSAWSASVRQANRSPAASHCAIAGNGVPKAPRRRPWKPEDRPRKLRPRARRLGLPPFCRRLLRRSQIGNRN